MPEHQETGEKEVCERELFFCQRCGFCCQGETTVSLNENDQNRMARHLGLSRAEMLARYWRLSQGIVQMRIQNGHCIFYEQGVGCTVHAGRPWRCREWPLHPSILLDENNFSIIAKSCPGLKSGMGYAEFCRLFQAFQKKRPPLNLPE